MNSLLRISLVPVEFFELSIRERFEERLRSATTFAPSENGSLQKTFQEICDFSPCVLKSKKQDGSAVVALHGSSACFVRITEIPDWQPSLASVKVELSTRRHLHRELIEDSDQLFGVSIQQLARAVKIAVYELKVNYVFSYYIYRDPNPPSSEAADALKMLAEPSLLDLDDMLSAGTDSGYAEYHRHSDKTRQRLEAIQDVDLVPDARTFVTWASVVCVDTSTGHRQSRTFDLLFALETRLQMVWNRCHAFSNLADAILVRDTFKKVNVDNFYWHLARTYDDAQGILAATTSSRANFLFDRMLETSGLQREINRLQGKVNLMDQFVRRRNENRDSRYKKTVEILLFFAAVSQLVPMFLTMPVFNSVKIGLLLLGVITAIGLTAILQRHG